MPAKSHPLPPKPNPQDHHQELKDYVTLLEITLKMQDREFDRERIALVDLLKRLIVSDSIFFTIESIFRPQKRAIRSFFSILFYAQRKVAF